VTVIPNGVDIPDPITARFTSEARNPKTALFLGRLYPVKGLPDLVEAWSRVAPTGWRLVIAGPDEAGHLDELKRLVSARRLQQVITFAGPVTGEAKRSLFLTADLFVLPTRSESFGMAIAESLAHAVPVLTTTAAPWPLLEEHSCGWRVTPDVDGLADGLTSATSSDPQLLASMGQRGREAVIVQFKWENVAHRFAAEYARIL
jgi:glycosyltransferase involved in cell wall biosynthesis